MSQRRLIGLYEHKGRLESRMVSLKWKVQSNHEHMTQCVTLVMRRFWEIRYEDSLYFLTTTFRDLRHIKQLIKETEDV